MFKILGLQYSITVRVSVKLKRHTLYIFSQNFLKYSENVCMKKMNNAPGLDPYTWVRLLMYGFTWIVGLAANFLGSLLKNVKGLSDLQRSNRIFFNLRTEKGLSRDMISYFHPGIDN